MRSVRPENNAVGAKLSAAAFSPSVIPHELIGTVLDQFHAREQRERKLPALLVVYLVIAMNIFTEESIEQAFEAMTQAIRFQRFDGPMHLCGKSGLCHARYRLGAAPIVELFHRVCKPIATPQTHGAFLFGLRLMAVDGTVEDVPDSPANAAAFGRQRGSRGDSAFPQLRNVYLVESGTHAVCDAIVRGYQHDERSAAIRLLRSVHESMLLMWDRGFHSYQMVERTLAVNAEFLGRVPGNVRLDPITALDDGSFLARIYPDATSRKGDRHGIVVRAIEYTIDDPRRSGHGERHRLITSLLDPDKYPAATLAAEYHQRWEIEITIDEIDTHQRVHHNRPLRSEKPIGVIQEAYGLLIAHYLVRVFIHEAALTAGIDPDRISFIDSLRVIRRVIPQLQTVSSKRLLPAYRWLIAEIARHQLPPRDNRSNPRVVRRKMSKFALKRPIHRTQQHPIKNFEEAVVMIT